MPADSAGGDAFPQRLSYMRMDFTEWTMATDPVCGMQVNESGAAASAERGGKRYYFCSTHCATEFNADPVKYGSVANTAASRGAKYTCPMHPEVVQVGPGA